MGNPQRSSYVQSGRLDRENVQRSNGPSGLNGNHPSTESGEEMISASRENLEQCLNARVRSNEPY